jgi:4'-phosphopantetheinyl transferase EntD
VFRTSRRRFKRKPSGDRDGKEIVTNRGISIKDGAWLRLKAAEQFFKELKQADAAVAIGSTLFQQGEMLPAERKFIGRAIKRRQDEFALGRSLARTALSKLAHPPIAIPAADDRAPIWPEGILVAAAARLSSGIQMLGIDLERIMQNSDLFDTMTTVSERQRL